MSDKILFSLYVANGMGSKFERIPIRLWIAEQKRSICFSFWQGLLKNAFVNDFIITLTPSENIQKGREIL